MTDIEIVVIDGGLHCSFASVLSKYFKKVWYLTPHSSPFPKMKDTMIGFGLPGVNKIFDIYGNTWDKSAGYNFDDIGLFVFLDVYQEPLQYHLVSLGKKVFGARFGGDMELYRTESAEVLEEHGIKADQSFEIIGIDNLIEYCKKHENKIIKRTYFRGDGETFFHKKYELSRAWLAEQKHSLGCFGDIYTFIICDVIDTDIETGGDFINVNGEYSKNVVFGVECKDKGYALKTTTYDKLPKQILEVHDKLKPIFKSYDYAGFYSSEIRVKGKDNYLIDNTCRAGGPPTETLEELITNWDEVLVGAANGEVVEPKYSYKYGVQIAVFSEWAGNEEQDIFIEKKGLQWVKLRNACVVNGNYKIINTDGLIEIAMVVGLGNTLDEAIEAGKKNCEYISGYKLEVKSEAIGEITKELEKMKSIGIDF